MNKRMVRLAIPSTLVLLACASNANAAPVNAFTIGIDSVFVNDDLGLGTGSNVSCFISKGTSSAPTVNPFPACASGLIAIPNNDSKFLNSILATKLSGNPAWIQIDTPGPSYSCGASLGPTQCVVINFGVK